MPDTATNITLDNFAMGFRAKYEITEPELTRYVDDLWERYGDRSVTDRGELARISFVQPEQFDLRFGDLGWPVMPDAIEYNTPYADNGAGSSIWFSKAVGVAHQRAGYW